MRIYYFCNMQGGGGGAHFQLVLNSVNPDIEVRTASYSISTCTCIELVNVQKVMLNAPKCFFFIYLYRYQRLLG